MTTAIFIGCGLLAAFIVGWIFGHGYANTKADIQSLERKEEETLDQYKSRLEQAAKNINSKIETVKKDLTK